MFSWTHTCTRIETEKGKIIATVCVWNKRNNVCVNRKGYQQECAEHRKEEIDSTMRDRGDSENDIFVLATGEQIFAALIIVGRRGRSCSAGGSLLLFLVLLLLAARCGGCGGGILGLA